MNTTPLKLLTTTEREAALLAPYAMHSADTSGRKHAEPPHAHRGPFQRDANRIVHSAAFRRLSHKTQVFTGSLGDYHRSRLTHTLEVQSIARTIGRALRLNEDLVEALALLHDIGHPPFGHAGETTLAACLAGHGGFGHNAHALRLVEVLEQQYQDFPGLNLSLEVLAGQAWRADKRGGGGSPLLEVQVVDAADSIAYDTHDADDAVELGLLAPGELAEIPLWRDAAGRVQARYAGIEGTSLLRAVVHELIDCQVRDLLEHAGRVLDHRRPESTEAVRQSDPLVQPSAEMAEEKAKLEFFLHERVYRHRDVLRMRARADEILREMFTRLVQSPKRLPASFQARIGEVGVQRSVGDYLAGMTDRYVQQEHARLSGAG